eukprot:5669770-Pyramimonas_sp.AAC.1
MPRGRGRAKTVRRFQGGVGNGYSCRIFQQRRLTTTFVRCAGYQQSTLKCFSLQNQPSTKRMHDSREKGGWGIKCWK